MAFVAALDEERADSLLEKFDGWNIGLRRLVFCPGEGRLKKQGDNNRQQGSNHQLERSCRELHFRHKCFQHNVLHFHVPVI